MSVKVGKGRSMEGSGAGRVRYMDYDDRHHQILLTEGWELGEDLRWYCLTNWFRYDIMNTNKNHLIY